METKRKWIEVEMKGNCSESSQAILNTSAISAIRDDGDSCSVCIEGYWYGLETSYETVKALLTKGRKL